MEEEVDANTSSFKSSSEVSIIQFMPFITASYNLIFLLVTVLNGKCSRKTTYEEKCKIFFLLVFSCLFYVVFLVDTMVV